MHCDISRLDGCKAWSYLKILVLNKIFSNRFLVYSKKKPHLKLNLNEVDIEYRYF